MKKATTKKRAPKTAQEYIAVLKVFGKTYEGTGATISEAIQNTKPGIYRGKSVLTITCGDKSQEKILPHFVTSRLFGPGSVFSKEIILKQVSARFAV